MKKGSKVELQQDFNVSANELWRAITEHDQMIEWCFENIPDFEPIVGFRTQFDVCSGERVFSHIWTVTEVIRHQKIVYDWAYQAYKGKASLSLEVVDRGSTSTLLLSHEVLEDFEDNIPEFTIEACKGGWNYFIKERLLNYLRD